MKRLLLLYVVILVSISSFAQTERYIEVDDIRYRVITEADGASTFGTVSVAIPEFGTYEGDIVIPNVIKETKDAYADSYKVTDIEGHAFYGAQHLRSVKLPPSVEKMGIEVFAYSSLENITIPVGNLTELGAKTFMGCAKLKEIIIPTTIKSIGEYAFRGCTALSNVVLNDGLENIYKGAFSTCNGLTSIDIPNTVRHLDDFAFQGCYRLSSIKLGTEVKRIGNYCFQTCIRLREAQLPEGLKELGEGAFKESGIIELKIPEKIHEISRGCFQSSKLRHITLPSRLDKVGMFAFGYCFMDSVDIPKEKQETATERQIVYTPFYGTTFGTDGAQKEREKFAKKNLSKLKVLTIDYSDWIAGMGDLAYEFDNTLYAPTIYPTSGEKYGLLELCKKPEGGNIPDIIIIKNGPYPEQYIVNEGQVLPHIKNRYWR